MIYRGILFASFVVLNMISPSAAFGKNHDEIHYGDNPIEMLVAEKIKNLWYPGKALSPGDSFTYNVCDYRTTVFTKDQPCYHVHLDFNAKLLSENRKIWIVQAEFQSHEDITHRIFLIDENTMQIEARAAGENHAHSIQNTILYPAKFSSSKSPDMLRIGERWGTIHSTVNLASDITIVYAANVEIAGTQLEVFVLETGLYEQSAIAISRNIPFPVSGIVYDPYSITADPPLIFSFHLLNYTAIYGGT